MNFLLSLCGGIFRLMHEDDPPREEVEMGLDEFLGKPTATSNADGIQKMTERIAYLDEEIAKTIQAIDAGDPVGSGTLAKLFHDRDTARELLASYQAQNQARN